MRIISGKYKGRRIEVPHTFKARPTTDFAKENLFNVLANNVDFESGPTALDLFAGTGSISLELLSRGCSSVTSVEKDYRHFSFLKKIKSEIELPEWAPLHADALRFVPHCGHTYDLVFADPPYALKELGSLPELIFAHNILAPEGIFILEHGRDYDFSTSPHFVRHLEYGSVNFSFFTL